MNSTLLHLAESCKKEESAKRIERILELSGDITIGLDVEFLWFTRWNSDTPRFISADSLFNKEGIFGTDGRSIIGEFRVAPSVDTRILVEFFEYALQLSKQFLITRDSSVQPFGMVYYSHIYPKIALNESIGVHIHFGNEKIKEVVNTLVQALDVFVLPFSKIFEPNIGNFVRTGTGFYGDVSDFRIKPYGIEYRSAPCFFDSKEITQGILALSKVVAFETLPGGKLIKEFLDNIKIKRYLLHDKKYLKYLCRRAEIIVKKLCCMYPLYKKEIDLLFNFVDTNVSYENFNKGIFEEWNIKTESLSYLEREIIISNRIYLNQSFIHTNVKAKIDKTQMLKIGRQ